MRVSSSMVFDAGVASMQQQTSSLLHTQQQVASGRRILTPADDPVAAAQALVVEQSSAINERYQTSQKSATEALGLTENALSSAGDLISSARTLVVQAGNPALSNSDRKSIATHLRQRFDELLGLANSADGAGQYQFSGYMGATKPFSGSVETTAAAEIAYAGDDGQRQQQVSASRQIAVSESGRDVFMRIRSGNGTFATAAAAANTGSGVIDSGAVLNPANWAAGNVPATGLKIVFAVAAGVTTYDIQDAATSTSLLTAPQPYVAGQAIPLVKTTAPAADYGSQVVIGGQPANGDAFTVTPSGSQSLFKTLATVITALEAPQAAGANGNTPLANSLGSTLANLDQANDNLLRVRASIGSSMSELDALGSAGSALGIQYQQTLSRLQDVDYAAAISQLTQQQTNLEAAQKSFLKVSGLSLFNFI